MGRLRRNPNMPRKMGVYSAHEHPRERGDWFVRGVLVPLAPEPARRRQAHHAGSALALLDTAWPQDCDPGAAEKVDAISQNHFPTSNCFWKKLRTTVVFGRAESAIAGRPRRKSSVALSH